MLRQWQYSDLRAVRLGIFVGNRAKCSLRPVGPAYLRGLYVGPTGLREILIWFIYKDVEPNGSKSSLPNNETRTRSLIRFSTLTN